MKKRQRKNRSQHTTSKIVLATALINLIIKLIELIEKLLDQEEGAKIPLMEKYTTPFQICQYIFKERI